MERISGGKGDKQPCPTFLDWALRVPEPKTGRLNFERFPYQRELYADGAEIGSVAVMKSTQIGGSALLLRWALYWPDVFGLTSLYLFPADRQMNDFSNHRIAPLLRGEYLASRVTSPSQINNVHQRQIGDGWLYLRGAQAEAGLESVDADALAFDEYDLIPATSIAVAERRISAPLSKGLIRAVGWPSVDGYGISRLYEQSDRRRWFVKCQACGSRQFLRFLRRGEGEGGDGLPSAPSGYVDAATATLRCGMCDKALAPDTIAGGEWVAEFPDRAERGYHIHHLLVPGANLDRLIRASQLTDPWAKQVFFNRDLGEPYSPEEGRLSLAAIQAAQSRGGYFQGPPDLGYSGDNLVTMGVDVASTRSLHVRISEHLGGSEKRALFIGEVDTFDELTALMSMYRVHMCAIDHLPEGRLARGFAGDHPGRVYLVSLAGPGQQDVLKIDPEMRHASVRRTEAMDTTIQLIREQRNLLPHDVPEGYVEHMRGPVRFVEKDATGRMTVGYRSTGADDYFMAEAFDLIARELFEHQVVMREMAHEEVMTIEEFLESEQPSIRDPFDYHLGPDDTTSLGPPEPDYLDSDRW